MESYDAQGLGLHLRQTREARELTLEEAERALRIRQRLLESFELGEFASPELSPIQVRGFVRNYAQYLGLDPDEVIAQLDAANSAADRRGAALRGRTPTKRDTSTQKAVSAPRNAEPPPVKPAASTPAALPPERKGPGLFGWLIRLVVVAVSLAIIGFVVVQLIGPANDSGDPEATPFSRNILGLLPPTQTWTPQPTATLRAVSTQAPISSYSGRGLLAEITMAQRAWLTISADDLEQYTGIARPGDRFAIEAVDNVRVLASNAEALDVIFNGQPQPSFGGRGQRVDITFRADGIQVESGPGFAPTPVESPTPLPTPTDPAGALIAQLTPTETPGPSPTPSDTPTITPTPSTTPTPSDTPTPSQTPTASDTPTITATPSDTPTITRTPTVTRTPSPTQTPSATLTPSPTANVPPRQPAQATPTKGPPG
jgi:transcriptional regulator with XRE-family HTH domain